MSRPAVSTETSKGTVARTSAKGHQIEVRVPLQQPLSASEESRSLSFRIRGPQELKQTLKALKGPYKRASFDHSFKIAFHSLVEYYGRAEKEDTKEYWKGRTLIYELNDIFDQNSEISDAVFVDGNEAYETLRVLSIKRTSVGFVFSECRPLREKVLFCGCYANELQRRGEKLLALDILEWLLSFLSKFIQSEELPCFGVRATLCFQIGSVLRKLEQHHRAELMFSKSMDLLQQRLSSRLNADLDDHLFIIRKQAMIIGFGYGLVNTSRGSLERAEHALTTASSLLGRSNDPFIPAYLDLLRSVVKRCQAGSNKTKLGEAIISLERARARLITHRRFGVRASWELALAKAVLGNYSEARKELADVVAFADEESDQKWQTNAHILESRMARWEGNSERALLEAELAFERSTSFECKTVLPLIDALITRGEAKLARAESGGGGSMCANARRDFKKAYTYVVKEARSVGELNRTSNPKIAAVCLLRIAQTYAREGDEAMASNCFTDWLRLEAQVEHRWVKELAQRVENEIRQLSQNFTICSANPTDWEYARNVTRLRKWLLTQALRKTGQNYSEAAKLIGVQRATLYQWLADGHDSLERRGRIRSRPKNSFVD